MGQTPSKFFLPSAPYGGSEAANALSPSQPAAQNPQMPLLPPNFQNMPTMNASPASPTGATSPSKPPNPLSSFFGGGGSGAGFMRGLFGALLFLLLVPSLFATTTVTGTLQNLGLGTVGQGAFVRFWLRGCGGNVPRIAGTALIAPSQGGVYFFDMVANGSGVISGTLYSTRDSTGALGGDIECGGSTLSVWYGMQVFLGGKGSVEIPLHAKNGITLDVTTAVPITQTPAATAPTGDQTYLRLDAANAPVSGNVGLLKTTGLYVTGLTVGNCVQVTSGGQLTTASGPCGTSSGTLTATGSPAAGQGAIFSGGTSLTSSSNWLYSASSGHTVLQGADGTDVFFSRRFTDTTPTGNFFNLRNAANNTDLFKLNVAAGAILTENSLSPSGTGALVRVSSPSLTTPTLSTPTLTTPVINGTPTGSSLQGSDTKLLTSGTVSGTGAALCTDANGGATTSGCGIPVIKAASQVTICTTGNSSYNQCGNTVSWGSSFADNNYFVACSGVGPTDASNSPNNGRAYVQVLSHTVSSVSIEIVTTGASAISWNEVDCIGVHP